jgi:FtsH-binding integral membrane protein
MIAAFDTHALWQMSLGMGAVVLIVVIILLMLLLSLVVDIQSSVASLLVTAGAVASHTVNIPKLSLTPPVLNLIIEEAIIQDGYMNALTDGYTGAGESL